MREIDAGSDGGGKRITRRSLLCHGCANEHDKNMAIVYGLVAVFLLVFFIGYVTS